VAGCGELAGESRRVGERERLLAPGERVGEEGLEGDTEAAPGDEGSEVANSEANPP
jgi:hypothetical protein